jgi:archaellum biogenesis ATPase FlaH
MKPTDACAAAPRPDAGEIRRALAVLHDSGNGDDVFEVRIPKAGVDGTISGYFSDHDQAVKAILAVAGKGPGVYVTLNPVNPQLLSRAQNRLKLRATTTTADRDVEYRDWLLIDVDPQRPADISSSDEEHDAALEKAREIRSVLSEEGWRAPVLGDSGNGGHLLYPVDLSGSDEDTKLLKDVLTAIARRFDDDVIKIDTTVFNAARISKVYGTVARKGDHTAARPHRLARLLDVPQDILNGRRQPVPRELLEAMAEPPQQTPPVPPAGATAPRRSNLDDFLARNLRARAPVAHNSGRKWVLEECPFNPDHKAPDAAIFESADGAIGFKCFHASCANYGWRDVREKFEPKKNTSPPEAWPEPDSNHSLHPKTKPVVYSYADVLSVWDYQSTVSYIVEDFLPEGAITLLTGDSGHGKTIFATALAGAIVTGGQFLGKQAVRRKVLYLDRENPLALVKQHLFDLHVQRTPDLIYWGGWCDHPPDGPAAASLHAFARTEKPVLIFDSLIAFHSGSEQDATETRRYLQYYRDLAASGATVVLLHHTGKSENSKQYRGSSDIKAAVDMAWLVEKLGDPAGLLSDLRIIPFKNRLGAGSIIPAAFRDGRFLCEQRQQTNREIFERLVGLNPNLTGIDLVRLGMAAGIGKTRVEQLLIEGVQQGWLDVHSGKRTAKKYSLAEPELGTL